MGANKIIRVECDHKGCGKIIMIPDPPLKPTTGADKVWSLTCAASNKGYWFCSAEHALAFLVAWIKATPMPEEKPKIGLNDKQLNALREMGILVETESRAHAAMEELETIPQSENFNLGD